jgi:cytidyltransferase-like protein
MTTRQMAVTGSFDDMRSRHIRFLEEAARLGQVQALVWDDEAVRASTGRPPKFPLAERLYLLQALRYVDQTRAVSGPIDPEALPEIGESKLSAWVVPASDDTPQKRANCAARGLGYHIVAEQDVSGFPYVPEVTPPVTAPQFRRKKVVVTGCYDWFHSGHVRFFEEVSALGDLYVVVGSDANVALLKGDGHPFFPQDERRYMVQSVRYVTQALISTGQGWMDAEPEIALIQPDLYAVNEDGDKPEKREFCRAHGLDYVVLQRTPKEGLPRRQSTDLRGF